MCRRWLVLVQSVSLFWLEVTVRLMPWADIMDFILPC